MDYNFTLIVSKYKKTLLRNLTAVKKVPGRWPHRRRTGQLPIPRLQSTASRKDTRGGIQTSERPLTSKCPNILTGNVFVERVRTVMNGPYPS